MSVAPVLTGVCIGIVYSSVLTCVVGLMLKPLAAWPEMRRAWFVALAFGVVAGGVGGWLV